MWPHLWLENSFSYRYRKHVVAALEGKDSDLYDWFRANWEEGFDIMPLILQEKIIPKDLLFFEKYWLNQFSGLLNKVNYNKDSINNHVKKLIS